MAIRADYPDRIFALGNWWDFDCIAGSGDAIYYRITEHEERKHLIAISGERP